MHSTMSWLCCVLLVSFLSAITAKPIQPEPSQPSPEIRGMDTLAGVSIGTNKATRSTRGYPQRSLDSLGNANYLRSLDSIGGQNFLRSLESLDDFLRDFDPETVARVLDYVNDHRRSSYRHGSHRGSSQSAPSAYDESAVRQLDYRTLDSLGGANLLRNVDPSGGPIKDGGVGSHYGGKRLDSLSGLTLGHQKRTFDEVDRTAFDGFNKRNLDEVDRVGFDGFSKRNIRSASTSSSS